ncbi:MAG: CpaF family protein, partial [Myxococcales bacterium]|nr:CpaF family protein [Myxococcales bacterium]
KFTPISKSIDDLIKLGALDDLTRKFLRAAIRDRKNILISGGAGSGKTTLLNCLSAFIPKTERIVVIEETSELALQQPHVIPMETAQSDAPDGETFDIRRLVKTALRLRPDRIIIGEVRGEEALDLIQAMSVGHAGSMATLHASSPLQALLRLETLLLMAKLDLPISAIRGQIASTLDLVLQTERLSNGTRRVTHVSEVLEPNEHGQYQLRHLIRYKVTNLGAGIPAVGRHHPVIRPTFSIAMEEKGLMNFDEFPYE